LFDKVEHWLKLCDDDMTTAKWLLKGERLLPMGFFCHLIAEKALKAVIAQNTEEIPPKIHDLKELAKRGNIADDLSEEQKLFLGNLMPLHIEGRYSEYKEQILKTLTSQKCKQYLNETEEFLCWVKKKLGR
jgi:HEPN domain-containing protein